MSLVFNPEAARNRLLARGFPPADLMAARWESRTPTLPGRMLLVMTPLVDAARVFCKKKKRVIREPHRSLRCPFDFAQDHESFDHAQDHELVEWLLFENSGALVRLHPVHFFIPSSKELISPAVPSVPT